MFFEDLTNQQTHEPKMLAKAVLAKEIPKIKVSSNYSKADKNNTELTSQIS